MLAFPKHFRPDPMRVSEAQFQTFLHDLHAADRRVRDNAILWLGFIQDPRAFDHVLPLLAEPHPEVLRDVFLALYLMHPLRALPYLVNALADHRPHVRRAAAQQLGHARDESAFEPLQRLLTDPDINVRCEALSSLNVIAPTRAPPYLVTAMRDPNGTFRWVASECLVLVDMPHLTDVWIVALTDDVPEVRYNAAIALGERGDPQVIEALLQVAENDDSEAFEGRSVGGQAAVAIKQIFDRHHGDIGTDHGNDWPARRGGRSVSRETQHEQGGERPF